jgi:hypothetical protein
VEHLFGLPELHTEDLRFLRDRGQFVGDLKRERMLHAAILGDTKAEPWLMMPIAIARSTFL